MPDETLRYDPATRTWTMPAHWAEDTAGTSAEVDRRIAHTHCRVCDAKPCHCTRPLDTEQP